MGGRGGRGREGGRKGGREKVGRKGGREEGRGRGGRRKFYLGAELIKCIDPNEGEALTRGSTFKPGGLVPPAPRSATYGGRDWRGAGGRLEGGREDIIG